MRHVLWMLWVFFFTTKGNAGSTYYNSVQPGGRASQMGGAYTALANDPSGLYYNPAGLVFGGASASDSTTALFTQETSASDVLGADQITFSTRGVATFVGFMKKLNPDWSGAVSVFLPAHNRDENYNLPGEKNLGVSDIHSKIKTDQSILYVSGGLARKWGSDSSIGLTFSLLRLASSGIVAIDYRSEVSASQVKTTDPVFVVGSNSLSTSLETYGVSPTIGMQHRLSPDWKVGFSLGAEHYVLTTMKLDSSNRQLYVRIDNTPLSKDEVSQPFSAADSGRKEKKKGGLWQPLLRVGSAYEMPSVVYSADLAYYGATRVGADDWADEQEAVLNGHLGIEWRNTPYVTRFGLFSNRGTRQNPGPNEEGGFINLWGVSVGQSYTYEKNQYGLAFATQFGQGDIRPLAGGPMQQGTTRCYLVALTIAEQE